MSTFTHSNSTVMIHQNISGGVTTVFNATTTEFSYISTDGHLITMTGDFTYGGGIEPSSGKVFEISIDLGDDGTTDIVLDYSTGISVSSALFSSSADVFWAAAAETVDVHNLNAQTANASEYSANAEDLNIGISVFDAGDDQINISGRYTVSGDVDTLFSSDASTLNGGDDTFTVDAPGTTARIRMYGDADNANDGTTVNGGDDTFVDVSATQLASDLLIIGDVQNVRDATLDGGNDTITGGLTRLQAYGDALRIEEGATVFGGDDTMTGSSQDDRLYGDVFSIDSVGQGSALFTEFLAGDDVINGGAGNDLIYGDVQQITAQSVMLAGGHDTLSGGDGDDTIYGNFGNDIINGDAGSDYIIGGVGNDAIDGGAGFDTVDYQGSDQVIINLDSVARDGVALRSGLNVDTGEIDTLRFIENVVGGDSHDTIWGSATRNRLEGGEGDDYLRGRAGNDTLVGGAGTDTLIGDSGADTADYSSSLAGVTVDLTTGNALDGFNRLDTLESIEWIIGSDFADDITGDTLNNRFFAGDGNDDLFGLNGNDLLFGEGGDDEIYGGFGNDRLYGGDGIDDMYGNEGNDVLDGGAGDDTLSGNTGDDRLFGRDGDDFLVGHFGTDILTGGAGDDRLDGGFDRDFLRGNEGDDFLIGSFGDDRIDGGDGVDTAAYFGDSTDYLITENNGVVVVEHLNPTDNDDGRDVLTNVEFLLFGDTTIDVSAL